MSGVWLKWGREGRDIAVAEVSVGQEWADWVGLVGHHKDLGFSSASHAETF